MQGRQLQDPVAREPVAKDPVAAPAVSHTTKAPSPRGFFVHGLRRACCYRPTGWRKTAIQFMLAARMSAAPTPVCWLSLRHGHVGLPSCRQGKWQRKGLASSPIGLPSCRQSACAIGNGPAASAIALQAGLTALLQSVPLTASLGHTPSIAMRQRTAATGIIRPRFPASSPALTTLMGRGCPAPEPSARKDSPCIYLFWVHQVFWDRTSLPIFCSRGTLFAPLCAALRPGVPRKRDLRMRPGTVWTQPRWFPCCTMWMR